ncbi:hypothetical protein QQF64_033256 [Cirrhinus molitorella]|uniref:Uncharacterized protein n=1 Tax=Cirrhinus molitorella TaxID=172907 RepID=A0ABR3MTC5_9TELE
MVLLKDGYLPPCPEEATACPSLNQDVFETKADSDAVCGLETDNLQSQCASDGHLPSGHEEETACPSLNQDVCETKADSDTVCGLETDNLQSHCASTDLIKMFGNVAIRRPVMIICDGSLVLMHSISIAFCRTGLEDLLHKYFLFITGQHPTDTFDLPILHRCLSHIMKNAKDLCKKQIPKHYTLTMHIFGLLACS